MRCITVQHKNVYEILKYYSIYRASESNIDDNILIKPYNFMKTQFNWDSIPIFLAPVGFYVEFCGAKFNKDSVVMEFDIPEEYIKLQKYYDWTDFIYFTEYENEFKDTYDTSIFPTIEDYGKSILNIDVDKNCRDAIQVTVEMLDIDWLITVSDKINNIWLYHNESGGKNKLENLNKYI